MMNTYIVPQVTPAVHLFQQAAHRQTGKHHPDKGRNGERREYSWSLPIHPSAACHWLAADCRRNDNSDNGQYGDDDKSHHGRAIGKHGAEGRSADKIEIDDTEIHAIIPGAIE